MYLFLGGSVTNIVFKKVLRISKKNKAKAISAELLELSLKNKLEETGKTR